MHCLLLHNIRNSLKVDTQRLDKLQRLHILECHTLYRRMVEGSVNSQEEFIGYSAKWERTTWQGIYRRLSFMQERKDIKPHLHICSLEMF